MCTYKYIDIYVGTCISIYIYTYIHVFMYLCIATACKGSAAATFCTDSHCHIS